MIETIFYFAQNPAEYNQNKNNNLISDRTISLVPNADGTNTGKIYRNGVEYGGGIAPASSTTLGGIKIGYTPNGNNYPVRLDGENRAYVNVPSTGGGGGSTTTIENPYDDTEIRNIITTINSDLDVIKARVSAAVIADMQEAINKYKAFIAKYGEDALVHIPNNWNEELQAFVQQVIRTDADGNGATWSELEQKYNQISAKVTSITESINVDGDITYESLISSLDNYIDTEVGAAFASLKTEWALTDEDLGILKWLSSGFESKTDATDTFANVFSASQDAISALQTKVTEIDGKYIAKGELAAAAADELAGVYVEADDQKALASLVASAGKDADGNPTTAAGIMVNAINGGGSEIKINADKVNIDADVFAQWIEASGITVKSIGDSNSATIIDADGDITTKNNIYLASGSFIRWGDYQVTYPVQVSTGETTGSSQTGEGNVSVGVDEGHTSAASPGSGPYAVIRFIETLNGQAYNKLYIYPSVEINGDLDVSGNITQNGNPIGGSGDGWTVVANNVTTVHCLDADIAIDSTNKKLTITRADNLTLGAS